MSQDLGPFTRLRRALGDMPWADIVATVDQHARARGIRWDDAARELSAATLDDAA